MSMASDYIYIFCIPGSGSLQPSCTPANLGDTAPTTVENNRFRTATASQRTNGRTASSNGSISGVGACGTSPREGSSRPMNRPQSALMDVPEDWAPLPARQNGNLMSSYWSNFSPTGDNRQPADINDTGQLGNRVAMSGVRGLSMVEASFPYELCVLPSYGTTQQTASCPGDTASSEFCPVSWSPRATSTPVQENRRNLCNAGAKNCWRRLFNRECCLRCVITLTTFRWLLLFFASVSAGCILAGVVLGVLYMSLGTSFLVLSILFIGLGVTLILVITIGWRCTPTGHEPCHLLFNCERWCDASRAQSRRRTDRHRGDHTLDQNQWFGGIIYPEFRSRTPPPTYIASVLDYEEFCASGRRSGEVVETVPAITRHEAVELVPATPPPAYRGRGMVREMSVSCPRARHPGPCDSNAGDCVQPNVPSTSPSTSGVTRRQTASSEFDGKWMCDVGQGAGCHGSVKPRSSTDHNEPVLQSNVDSQVAGYSSDET